MALSALILDLKEMRRIADESARKLLQISIPPVKYLILRGQGLPEDNALVREAARECKSFPPRVKLLASLREDGTWPISRQRKMAEDSGPGPPIGWTYTTMLRNMYMLTEYGARIDDGNLRACVERIFSWQTKEGYIPGPWTDVVPLTHYNGYALRNLGMLGVRDDPRMDKLARWLVKNQRSDGGWIIPYFEDIKALPQYKYVRMRDFLAMIQSGKFSDYDPKEYDHIPSCTWTTMMVVRGLIQHPRYRNSQITRRGADFFLDRFFKRNYHSTLYYSESHWTKLKYPTYYGSGLCALDILTAIGYGPDDPRMEKPMQWLLSARSKDGFWYQSDRPNPEKDQWITDIAIDIIYKYTALGGVTES